MSSLHQKLRALSRRLRSINQSLINQDDRFEANDLEINPSKPKYVCVECAWTTSTNAVALAHHFTYRHAFRFKCPDCRSVCDNQEKLKEHEHLCPGCQRLFATVKECSHHEPCESQCSISLKHRNHSPTQTIIDLPLGEKAPVSAQSILDRRGSVLSGSCPDPGCSLTFVDFDTLYEHYIGSHSLCIVYHGHSKPFKCPFCSKGYQHERFIPGHVRTHNPKALSVLDFGSAEDQETLIQQSRVAMANRESRLRAETQVQADNNSSEEEGHSSPIKQEEDYFVVHEDGILYIVYTIDRVKLDNSNPGQSMSQTELHESQRFRERVPIGLVLQACPIEIFKSSSTNKGLSAKIIPRTSSAEHELSDSMDLNEEYPERFALDDDELPLKTNNRDYSIIATQILDGIFHQSLSDEIIRALQMQHFVNSSELEELLTYFLDEYQRMYVLEQFGNIDLNQHDNSILSAIHGTVLKDLIDVWVDFNRLAIRFAPDLIRQANDLRTSSVKSVTWALLQYCLTLENMIHRNEINIAHHFLQDLPLDDLVATTDAPFPCLVSALVERVKNRTVHDPSIVFTNDMILRGVEDYVKVLQMILRPLYPVAAGHEGLWRELRLL